jgi:hypothetical protein
MSRLSLVAMLALAPALSAFGSVHHARHHSLHRVKAAHRHAATAHVQTATYHHGAHLRRAALHTEMRRRHALLEQTPLHHAHIYSVSPLKGSYESLVRQNTRNEAEGLTRIENDAQLEQMLADRQLVPVPAGGGMQVNEELPANRRYCRPWTANFLKNLARAHQERFGRPLMVTSAVRTVEYQRYLMRINGNAAPAEGDIASPHLTGATIDIAKKGLSMSEIAWMRAYLLPLETAGKLDVEEEFRQACFHITVYENYSPQDAPAWPPRRSATLLAARMR